MDCIYLASVWRVQAQDWAAFYLINNSSITVGLLLLQCSQSHTNSAELNQSRHWPCKHLRPLQECLVQWSQFLVLLLSLAQVVPSPPALTGQKETAGFVGRTARTDVEHHTSSCFSRSRRVKVGK